jgi:hypothetical protein
MFGCSKVFNMDTWKKNQIINFPTTNWPRRDPEYGLNGDKKIQFQKPTKLWTQIQNASTGQQLYGDWTSWIRLHMGTSCSCMKPSEQLWPQSELVKNLQCHEWKCSSNKLLASRGNLYVTNPECVLEKIEEQLNAGCVSTNAWTRGRPKKDCIEPAELKKNRRHEKMDLNPEIWMVEILLRSWLSEPVAKKTKPLREARIMIATW